MKDTTSARCSAGSSRLSLNRGRVLDLSKPVVMGILNVTPDSFSDGGTDQSQSGSAERALKMIEQGAAIVDVGGESSRPGAESVPLDVELRRVIPVIELIRRETDVAISVDTYKAAVAREAIAAGADIVNDISALRFDSDMAGLVAQTGVLVALMHMKGRPGDMQQNPEYDDCVNEISEFFQERLDFCELAGIERDRIIIDPGIGFGKRLQDNLELIKNVQVFRKFALPVMIGISRKSFIGALHNPKKAASERLGGSIAATTVALMNGVDIVRVHDVEQTTEALKVLQAIKELP